MTIINSPIDVNKHPRIREAYELCLLVEKLPASSQQTELSVSSSNLLRKLWEDYGTEPF